MLKTFDIYYDISPLYLVELDKHLRACATDKEININICSPGGDIYAGIAIAEKLRACGKRVNARVWRAHYLSNPYGKRRRLFASIRAPS